MLEDQTTVNLILNIVLVIVSGFGGYAAFRARLTAFRKFVDLLEDALYDNKVSEQEFADLFEQGKKLIERNKNGSEIIS